MGSQRVRHDWGTFTFTLLKITTPSKERAELSCFSHVWLSVTGWTEARQASRSMGFSRQEYWSGLPFCSPGDLPNPGIDPWSPALQEDSLPLSHQGHPTYKDWQSRAIKTQPLGPYRRVISSSEPPWDQDQLRPFLRSYHSLSTAWRWRKSSLRLVCCSWGNHGWRTRLLGQLCLISSASGWGTSMSHRVSDPAVWSRKSAGQRENNNA